MLNNRAPEPEDRDAISHVTWTMILEKAHKPIRPTAARYSTVVLADVQQQLNSPNANFTLSLTQKI